MGLISFIKDAGVKVIGMGKSIGEEKAEASVTDNLRVIVQNERASQRLINSISDLGFKVEDLNISIDVDIAKISGTAKNQETREKVILIVGNTFGIAAVKDEMIVKISEAIATFHTVERGETLSKIASKLLGDGMKYTIIFEANKPMLTHPDRIYPGLVLRIPSVY